jgi:hypothetical protein
MVICQGNQRRPLAARSTGRVRQPLPPPRDLSQAATKIWKQITGSRPADWFDEGSAPLLRRLCRSAVSVEKLHDAYDKLDPTSAKAADILKQIAVLNASVAGLSQKLRLSVQSVIGWDAIGRRTERGGGDDDDGLLGGFASRQDKGRPWQQ